MLVSPTIQSPHGRIRSITGTDPAANTEISETVPARRRWRLLSIRFSLISDVNAANRFVRLVINDGTNNLLFLQGVSAQTASLTVIYNFSLSGTPEVLSGGVVNFPLPDLILPAGYIISTVTTSIQAGDNYGTPFLLVEEWIDP